MVNDRNKINLFKLRRLFGKWIEFMNFYGDFLVMISKAKKYNYQALTSKALLSLYIYTLK
jgi:hypothetical protein